MLGGVTSLAAAVGGLSFFTSAHNGSSNGSNRKGTPTFGVCDMTTGTVLSHLALSPIQHKPTTATTIDISAKESAAAAVGKGGNGESATTNPPWQVVDLRSKEGGFWIAEVWF